MNIGWVLTTYAYLRATDTVAGSALAAEIAAETEEMDAAAQAQIDHVLAAVGPAPDGVELVSEPVRGTPGFAMIEESRDADLVVLGSRGHGGFSELLLGSTTSEVAAHSHCPVAVVR